MWPLTTLLLLGAVATSAPARAAGTPEKVKLLLMPIEASEEYAEKARTIGGLLAAELGRDPALLVVTGLDVQRALELEGEKQRVDCSADTSCLTELAGALGAELVLHGDLGALGETMVLNLSLLDTANMRVRHAAVRSRDLDALPGLIAPELNRLLAPALALRHLPQDEGSALDLTSWLLVGVGGVVAVAGAVALGVGLWPALEHAQAADALRALEDRGPDGVGEAPELYQQQVAARQDWEGWGQYTAIGGGVALGLGAAALASGLALRLLSDPAEESP